MTQFKLQRFSTGPIPTLDEVVKWLEAIADVDSFEPDADLETQGVDSLDLIELAAALEDTFPGLEFDDSMLEDALEDRTLRAIYDRVVGQFDAVLD